MMNGGGCILYAWGYCCPNSATGMMDFWLPCLLIPLLIFAVSIILIFSVGLWLLRDKKKSKKEKI